MRDKNPIKKRGGQSLKLSIYYLGMVLLLIIGANAPRFVTASSCPDLRIVFARGSGGERWHDANYLSFKTAIETKLTTVNLNYEFIDLDYPAVGVGINRLGTTVGALVGAGNAYEFGDSVKTGIRNLNKLMNSDACPNTKYVIGGYSQGAMVISKALPNLNPSKIIYAATFGDPWIYLPEGAGIMPAACKGKKLSDYRKYVPDCHAYKGLLGANMPYRTEALAGKVGTWCNKRDIFCSSHVNVSDHLGYIADDLYNDASKVIFDKITRAFGLPNRISSPHDTAILIDVSGSTRLFDQYQGSLFAIVDETFLVGGRVAFYSYRGNYDGGLMKHCDFNSCTPASIKIVFDQIRELYGGNCDNTLLDASFRTMSELDWKQGSTKSLVVLTEGNFLSPDRAGMSLDRVVKLSKRIDPVNFYIVTKPELAEEYAELATQTKGMVVSDIDNANKLVEYIMTRYDALPQVEESDVSMALPKLTVEDVNVDGNTVKIKFKHTGSKVLIILNDGIIGLVDGDEVAINEIDFNIPNQLKLVPINDDVRGEEAIINLKKGSINTMLKAPNSGQL